MKQGFKSDTRIAGTKAVGRALRIARTFTDARPEWTLAALSRELGLSKPTALRLLTALEREGIVTRHEASGAYRLGPAAIELGARAQRSNSIASAARPEMENLTRATGETASIEILSDDETVILDEVQGGHLIGTSPSVGTRWPAHATSTGKVLLAAALEREPGLVKRLTRRSNGRLRRLTPSTIVTAARLTAELGRVSRAGYSTARGELEEGYVAVGAPVRNHAGQVVAAVSLGGPSTRFTNRRLPRLTKLVREAAAGVSQRLGFSARSAPAPSRESGS
ncbi:MAG TPA: IclR family transcriptional regulator [Gemmatimonadales bacterium]